MKSGKLSFSQLQGALSRDEMKNITAGNNLRCQPWGATCDTGLPCCPSYTCSHHRCQIRVEPPPGKEN